MMRLILKSKALLLAMIPVLLFALVFSDGAVLILKKQTDAEVKDTHEYLLGNRHAEFEYYIQIAMGSIQAEYDRSANGDPNARAEVIARPPRVKYGKDGYIFSYGSQVVRLLRGDSPVDTGKNFRDRRDPSGVYLNRELAEVGRNGSHYATYTSPLSGNEGVAVPKLSYTLYLPKRNVMIGSAVSFDGVGAQLVEVRRTIGGRTNALIASITAIAGVPLAALPVTNLAVANAMLCPPHQIRQNLDDITAGEGGLTRHPPMTSHDELGELAGSFNCFVEKIHSLVRQIAEITGDLRQLVEQMSAQAERSEQTMGRQYHETDQVTTATNEMSATAHEVVQNAQRVAEAVQWTDHEGQATKHVMDGSIERTHALVNEIRDNSSSLDSLQQGVQSIVSVSGMIRSIAGQTDPLALNAAIKATHVGEAGRGFAMVADEVRALASRIQQSTQGIQGMVDCLQQGTGATVDVMRRSGEAGEGTSNRANQAGDPLDAVAQLIATANVTNAQIASTTEEQTAVAEEVNRSMHQIAGTVDSIADETQQGAQAARSLTQLDQGLSRPIGRFHI